MRTVTRSAMTLIENKEELLRYLKNRTHAYHLSNLFFRDFHYAILSFAESKRQKLSYGDAEKMAEVFIESLVQSGILKPVKPGSWMLNYPEFRKVSEKPASLAKAATPQVVTKPVAVSKVGASVSTSPTAATDSPVMT